MPLELRPFQQEALAVVRDTNVVLVGATGVGKTFVAVALLSQQDYSSKRAFFLAPTRQLVVQIAAKIRQTSSLSVTALYASSTDLWDAGQWQRELQRTQVLVCTPEIVRNMLFKGCVGFSSMNLLVFDECHHVTKRHPYAQIMNMYDQQQAKPRILGTTACPTRQCAEKLHAQLRRVEGPSLAASAPMLLETFPEEALKLESLEKELEEVKAVAVYQKLLQKGKSDAASNPSKLTQMKKRFAQSCATVYSNLGLWCYYRFVELEMQRLAMAVSPLVTGSASMYGYDKDAVKVVLLLRAKREKCNFACSNKVKKTEERLRERLFIHEDKVDERGGESDSEGDSESGSSDPFTGGSPDLQGVIFVKTRIECRVLSEFLNEMLSSSQSDLEDEVECPAKQAFCASIVGRAPHSDTASFLLPKMETTLSKFESGDIRVLVSTAGSVEGVDFPKCRLVVVMDRVDTARKLTQLKGRARHEDGVVFYLAEEGDLAHHLEFQRLLREAESIEKLAFGRDKGETLQQQPRSVAMQMPGESYKIVVQSTGAVVDLDSSVACINRFVQCLPKRLFTVDMKRLYTVTENRRMFVAELKLPVELGVGSFRSKPMPSKANARAIAAFKACKKLREMGLLDDSLNSIYRTTKVKASSNVRELKYFVDRLHL